MTLFMIPRLLPRLLRNLMRHGAAAAIYSPGWQRRGGETARMRLVHGEVEWKKRKYQ